MNDYCTCAFYDSDGRVSDGSPCTVHPAGCEHGRQWHEPCNECENRPLSRDAHHPLTEDDAQFGVGA
jgi:hypothetical protein